MTGDGAPRRPANRYEGRIAEDETPRDHADGGTAAPRRALPSRLLWAVIGLVCVVLGAVGIVVPGLPTTVFFIAAAACFSRSSPRLEAWVLGLPKIGPAVRDYRAGLGMPKSAKVAAIVMIVVAVSISVVLIDSTWIRLVVAGAGLVGVGAVLRVPTRPPTVPPT